MAVQSDAPALPAGGCLARPRPLPSRAARRGGVEFQNRARPVLVGG